MRHRGFILLALLSLTMVAGHLQGSQFMAVEELQRGMRGVGRTVFQGVRIDTFEVEILGVVQGGLGPRQDLILARLSGGPLSVTGLIRGMSGSPVYVDGRLIGAVAYGWSFSKDPICGITPIHQMLQIMERDSPPTRSRARATRRIDLDPAVAALVGQGVSSGEEPVPMALEPLATPVWISGMTPAAGSVLRELLRPMGLDMLEASGGQASVDAGPLEPGASLGVQLISGDMSATGIGVLTYVADHRLVGFGHPLMLLGATDMPMTSAYIHEVLPSQAISFKIGAATLPIGAVRQDRAPGIAGLLGEIPAMLPVAVDIGSTDRLTAYRFGVVRHQDLLPALTRAVLLGALEASEKLFGDATLELRAAIQLADGQTLVREQVYSGPAAVLTAALEAVQPLQALVGSPFAQVRIDSVHFSLEVREWIDAAQVRGLRVEQATVAAGDSLRLEVTLQPYRGTPVRQRLSLALPADLAPGPLTLRVGNGRASQHWEMQRRPDAFAPRDSRQQLELLAYYERNDELIVELYRSETSLTVDGRELPGLPPSAQLILSRGSSAGHLGPVHGQVVLRRRLRTQYVLSGEQTLQLTVRKP